jgi:hypothetical protein
LKTQNSKLPDHPELPGLFKPVVHVPAVLTPDGAGGWNVKPGKPIVMCGADEISTAEAARLLGYSQSWIGHLCDEGEFLTARKKGPSPRAMWLVQRAEVMSYASKPPEQSKKIPS